MHEFEVSLRLGKMVSRVKQSIWKVFSSMV